MRKASTEKEAAATADLHREADLGRAYDTRLLRRLWAYIQPHRKHFWASVLCLPATAALSLAQPYLLKVAIDEHIAHGDAGGLLRIGGIYTLAMIGEFALIYLQYYLTMKVAQHSLAALRLDLVTHLQRLSGRFFDRNPVGRLVTRLTTDVDVINEMFAAGAFTILMDVATLLGIIFILLFVDWRLAAATLAVTPALALAINFFRIKARTNYRLIRDRLARLNAYLQEAIAGITVIQLFARESQSFARFDALNDDHRSANHAANLYEATLFSVVEAVSSICMASILWYGGGRIVEGTLAFGTLVAFIEYMQRFFVPIRDFSSKYAVMQSAMSSAERVFQLLDTPVEIDSAPRAHKPAAVRGRIARRVHQLDGEIDALGRRVRLLRRHNVFFAQDRRMALDQQPRALVAIGDQTVAEDEAFAGFELDLEAHVGSKGGEVAADVAEALDGDGGALEVHLQGLGGLADAERDAAAGGLLAPLGAADVHGLAGDDGGDGVALVHGVGVHEPRHGLGVGVDVGGGDVDLLADDDLDLGEVAAGEALQLESTSAQGVSVEYDFSTDVARAGVSLLTQYRVRR